eukprot:c48267_g1_i1 orf=1-180(-)
MKKLQTSIAKINTKAKRPINPKTIIKKLLLHGKNSKIGPSKNNRKMRKDPPHKSSRKSAS